MRFGEISREGKLGKGVDAGLKLGLDVRSLAQLPNPISGFNPASKPKPVFFTMFYYDIIIPL